MQCVHVYKHQNHDFVIENNEVLSHMSSSNGETKCGCFGGNITAAGEEPSPAEDGETATTFSQTPIEIEISDYTKSSNSNETSLP